MRTLDEYKIRVQKAVHCCESWEVLEQELFPENVLKHKVERETVRKLYEESLRDVVLHDVLDNITELCCSRNEEFFGLIDEDKNPSVHSELVQEAIRIRWSDNDDKYDSKITQLDQLRTMLVLNQKMQKQVNNKIRKLLNRLVAHFFSNSAEKEACRVIGEWLQSGEVSLSQWKQWQRLINDKSESTPVTLETLRLMKWETDEDDCHLHRLKDALADIDKESFFEETEQELLKMLRCYLRQPVYSQLAGGVFEVVARTIYTSQVMGDVKELINDKSLAEVRIHAADACIVDYDFNNDVWHGKNLCIVADKLIVQKRDTIIDVSGTGYKVPDEIKTERNGVRDGEAGKDGIDGRAGESSGNVAIAVNTIRNANQLTIHLNGGNAETGMNGGRGANGRIGKGVTRSDIDGICVSYNSIYRTSWDHFTDWDPSEDSWKCTDRTWNRSKEFLYRTYEGTDGRKITYSMAGDKGYFYTTYELFFMIEGGKGGMGGKGGKNGVGGEGGRPGELHFLSLSNGRSMNADYKIEQRQGIDGVDGKCGNPGLPGSHGNDMVMIDRSAKEPSKHYIGGEHSKLSKSYQYKADKLSRLDGYRKHEKGYSDCFVSFDTTKKEPIQIQESTDRRTCADRRSESRTVTKTTIAIDSVVSDFYEHFESDSEFTGSFAGDSQEWQALEVEEEEVEAEETVQQEVALVRTHVEDEGIHDSRSRAEKIDPEDVLLRINDQSLDLNALATLFEDIFRVVLHLQDLKIVKAINGQIGRAQQLSSEADNHPNGMSRAAFDRFLEETRQKLTKKIRLSSDLSKDDDISSELPEEKIDMVNSTLKDVQESKILDDIWQEIDTTNPRAIEELNAFFSQLQYIVADGPLLLELYKLHTFLDKSKDVFTQFKNDDLNWADPNKVKCYMDSFLTEKELEEREKKETKEREKVEKKRKKEEKKNQKEENMKAANEGNENEMMIRSDAAEADNAEKKDEGFLSYFTNIFSSSSEGKAFKEVNKIMKQKGVFEPFQQLVKADQTLKDRFSYPISSYVSQRADPCSIPQSVIQMYFLSARILDVNMRFYRYWKLYTEAIMSPNDWFQNDSSEEMKITSHEHFIKILGSPPTMPRIDSNMCKFMQTNGIRCSAYRHYISDEKQINVQVFRSCGYCEMRLVENINPNIERVERLYMSDSGFCTSIHPNLGIRKLKHTIESGSLTTSKLPISTEQDPPLSQWFNSTFKHKIEEWTSALKVSMDSKEFLQILHEVYSLRGCPDSLNEWLFMLNTTIESVCNVGLSERAIASLTLRQDGELRDIWLALRVLAEMKGRCKDDIETMRKRLEPIREPRLRALLGSKFHEFELDEETLDILIKMLAHADDRVVELAGMKIDEWIDIAKCQKWNDFEPLLKRYGAVGYYLVFLDSLQREETSKLREIIDRVAENECFIFEKTISRLAYLISYNEVTFDENYAKSVEKMLRNLSDAETKHSMIRGICHIDEEIVKKTNTINLVVNEYVQNEVLKRYDSNKESSLDEVFPKGERSLESLVRLTINPQDSKERADERATEMQTIMNTIGKVNNNEADDIYSKTLRRVYEELKDKCNIVLRDTQKIAVLSAVMSGRNLLSQVNTGEGKSYIIATLAIMRILLSEGKDTVDIVTSSSVLAQRDAKEMEKLYAAFGIRVAHNCDEDIEKRKEAYKCAVVYGDITRFERDYLLHSFYKKNVLGARTRCNVIVDEVDSMLLDNGSNMLYLSHTVAGIELLEPLFVFIHRELRKPKLRKKSDSRRDEDTFSSIEVRRAVLRDIFGLVTREDVMDLLEKREMGKEVGTVWRILSKNKIVDEEGMLRKFQSDNLKKLEMDLKKECGEDTACRVLTMLSAIRDRVQEIAIPAYLHGVALRHLDEFITNAKKAMFLEPDVEYVVDLDHTGRSDDLNAQVTIIDRGTGTDLSSSQWSEGLHQFLQLKHGCRLTPLSMKAVFVSNVSYLKGYERLNGFSGTLGSVEESKSLVSLYGADLVRIPTFKPKIFNENVPVLSTKRKEWVKNVFDEVCDQVCAKRSVLVICKSIAEVEEFEKGFEWLIEQFLNDQKKSGDDKKTISECMKTLTIYKREFDEFDFGSNGYGVSRLIISTNLAGRGTDIKLSDDLIKHGGLHVIISFLPENSRIEDQAYGRAARCGQPGSGQIIALVDENSGETTNIFQLKQFRDNAEVHRLRSLSEYYHYHIEVEERCLDLFRSHCSHVLEQVYSGSNETLLPTKAQVVYFALLDEWADWVDSMADNIKQCEKNRNQNEKAEIINKVKKFLNSHPLPERGSSLHDAINWIRAPQPLLTLALVDVEDERQHEDARKQLEDITKKHPYFAAEASYYRGIIAQQKIRQLKTTFMEKKEAMKWEDVTWYNPGHWLTFLRDKASPVVDSVKVGVATAVVLDVRDTPEWLIENSVEQQLISIRRLLHARGMLSARMQRKAELKRIITMLQNTSTKIMSNGYAAQCKEATALLETLIGNIDDMLGHTVKREDVRRVLGEGVEAERASVEMWRELEHCGVISEVSLSHDISSDQLQAISRSHVISATTLTAVLNEIRKNGGLTENLQDEKVISSSTLLNFFNMPSALGFWRSISRAGCFLQESSYFIIEKSKEIALFKDIPVSTITSNPFILQLSTKNLNDYRLYKMKDVAHSFGKDAIKNIRLEEHLTAGNVFIELVGVLNPLTVCNDVWLDEFDYVSVEDVARQLNLPKIGAEWVIATLVKADVLGEIGVKRASSQDSGIEDDKSDQLDVEPSAQLPKTVYRLKDRVSCEMFPKCMRASVQSLLARQFSYGYALREIRSSIKKIANAAGSGKNEKNDEKHSLSIILPDRPLVDLYNDMLAMGILQKQRVTQTLEEVYDDDHGVMKEIREAFIKKAPRILLNKSTLTPTITYFNEKCAPVGVERSRVTANGLRMLATVEKPNKWRYYAMLFLLLAPLALLAVGVVSLFVSPIIPLIALGVIAAVGTTIFFMNLFVYMQSAAAVTDITEDEEFHIVRDCHKTALKEDHAQRAELHVTKAIGDVLDAFVENCSLSVLNGGIVTESKEEVGHAAQLIEECCSVEWDHVPMLREGISGWIIKTTHAFQTECFKMISERTKNLTETDQDLEKQLRLYANKFSNQYPPAAIFAFASLLLANVNAKLRLRKLPKLKTMLSFEDYKNIPGQQDRSTNSLAYVLSTSLKRLIGTLLEDDKSNTIQPTWQRLSSILNESRMIKGTVQPDEATMSERSKQHSSEQLLNRERTVDILATDLHRIFLRIAFHSLTPRLLAHMVLYNYPLSVHCATRLFDATVHLFQNIGIRLDQFDIILNRGRQNIIKYSVNLSKNNDRKKIIMELQDECFYTVEKAENVATKQLFTSGLFQALQEKFPQFADRYIVDAANFQRDLARSMEQNREAPKFWQRIVKWHADEKLRCHAAI